MVVRSSAEHGGLRGKTPLRHRLLPEIDTPWFHQ
ncbi:MAG: hypothetical protein KatS3mg111_1340 [Pirellulaceae bacterium]|nr:MAG: hypothetical protein KatS3mg111_1340 [Pirellulaceae bacterium]